MKILQKTLLSFVVFLPVLTSCNQNAKEEKTGVKQKVTDAAEPAKEEVIIQDWIAVQSKVSRMTTETTYEEIISELGKPYEEYSSPSLPEEYVMFYNVPGVKGALFWVMLNTETKKFLYWSGEKQEK